MHLYRFTSKCEDVGIYYRVKNYIEKRSREGLGFFKIFLSSYKAYWKL